MTPVMRKTYAVVIGVFTGSRYSSRMIYIIRAGKDGPVKIGTATDATKRINSLKGASYLRLHVVRLIEGGRREEQALHREFRHLRIKGEWFTYDPRMLKIDPSNLPTTDTEAPHKFAMHLKAIGWSVRELSKRLRCNPALAIRWTNGRSTIPEPLAKWLADLAKDHLDNPPPTDWRVRVR